MTSLIFLQNYWWSIISLIAGTLVFLLFVQGGQTFIFSLPKSETQRSMIVNCLGRKWEFTFTTLVTFGGAFFASFPLFYSTSFGGAYWLWMAILFSFILQAISYEYRSKPSNIYGQKTFELFLYLNGSLGPFLIGTAVATFFTGVEFSLNDMNQVQWHTSWHGIESLLNLRNLTLGFAILFLTRVNGLLYIISTIDEDEINWNAHRKLIGNAFAFIIFFLYFLAKMFTSAGFAVNPDSEVVSIEKYKYLTNYLQMPVVSIIFLSGVAGVLYGIAISIFKGSSKGFRYAGPGTVLTVFSLMLVAGYNGTAFYPSTFDLQSSLTLRNASSGQFTLTIMTYVSFIIPLVAGYIWYAWRSINNKKITEAEMNSEGHVY